ncbi:MAG: phosphotransferase [Clostridiales bacterium]|nr:phosphotransferase [Clostridiales bacterium]
MNEAHAQMIEIIEENYSLGNVVEIQEIFGGYTSRAFRAALEKNGERKNWFFREYLKPKPESEVLFEHNLLLHARKNGFDKGAVPMAAKDGKSYVCKAQDEGGHQRQRYFALYEFLAGDEPYDWIENIMPQKSYLGIAGLVAEFHDAVSDFDPEGCNGSEPPILEFIKEFPEKFLCYYEGCINAGIKNRYTDYMHSQLDCLEETANRLCFADAKAGQLPVIPVQCDVHPGNFKFAGDECVGIFDFEAAKMDLRLFEIALGVFNCFSSWQENSDGAIRLSEAKEFLSAYNAKLLELGSSLPPLTKTEKQYFPEALQLSNMYMAQWCIRVYCTNTAGDPDEYFWYLEHMMRSIKWVEENKAGILAMAEQL